MHQLINASLAGRIPPTKSVRGTFPPCLCAYVAPWSNVSLGCKAVGALPFPAESCLHSPLAPGGQGRTSPGGTAGCKCHGHLPSPIPAPADLLPATAAASLSTSALSPTSSYPESPLSILVSSILLPHPSSAPILLVSHLPWAAGCPPALLLLHLPIPALPHPAAPHKPRLCLCPH